MYAWREAVVDLATATSPLLVNKRALDAGNALAINKKQQRDLGMDARPSRHFGFLSDGRAAALLPVCFRCVRTLFSSFARRLLAKLVCAISAAVRNVPSVVLDAVSLSFGGLQTRLGGGRCEGTREKIT
jgi:hypothetical protein